MCDSKVVSIILCNVAVNIGFYSINICLYSVNIKVASKWLTVLIVVTYTYVGIYVVYL